MLQRRSELTMAIHRFFQDRNFIHVETPLVSTDTVVDRHIDPVPIARSALTGSQINQDPMWLQTSPEFAMKRLVIAGMPQIYQICKSFRQSEHGSRHSPEFTMLEWYRAGDGIQEGMQLLSDFVATILKRPASEQISYRDAFLKFAQIDPLTAEASQLADICRCRIAIAGNLPMDAEKDFWLDLILTHLIEPHIGWDAPCIIYDWPQTQSALAIVRPAQENQPPVAERFELYIDGVELANGYHELRDADELYKRNTVVNLQRIEDGKPPLPVNSRLLEAMRSGMPICSGVALGVDRLLMVMTGATSIDDVMAFGFEMS